MPATPASTETAVDEVVGLSTVAISTVPSSESESEEAKEVRAINGVPTSKRRRRQGMRLPEASVEQQSVQVASGAASTVDFISLPSHHDRAGREYAIDFEKFDGDAAFQVSDLSEVAKPQPEHGNPAGAPFAELCSRFSAERLPIDASVQSGFFHISAGRLPIDASEQSGRLDISAGGFP